MSSCSTDTAVTSSSILLNLPLVFAAVLAIQCWLFSYPVSNSRMKGWRARIMNEFSPCATTKTTNNNQHASINSAHQGCKPAPPHQWREHMKSPVVEKAWETLCGSIVQEFIYDTWYVHLTPDKEFPSEIRRILNTSAGQLALRGRTIDLRAMLHDLSELFMEQVELYRDTRETILMNPRSQAAIDFCSGNAQRREHALKERMMLDGNLHPALQHSDGDYRMLRAVSNGFVGLLLDPIDSSRAITRAVARELLSSCVLRPLMMFCTPYHVNKGAYRLLKNHAITRQPLPRGAVPEMDALKEKQMRGHFAFEKRIVTHVEEEEEEAAVSAMLSDASTTTTRTTTSAAMPPPPPRLPPRHVKSRSYDDLSLDALQLRKGDTSSMTLSGLHHPGPARFWSETSVAVAGAAGSEVPHGFSKPSSSAVLEGPYYRGKRSNTEHAGRSGTHVDASSNQLLPPQQQGQQQQQQQQTSVAVPSAASPAAQLGIDASHSIPEMVAGHSEHSTESDVASRTSSMSATSPIRAPPEYYRGRLSLPGQSPNSPPASTVVAGEDEAENEAAIERTHSRKGGIGHINGTSPPSDLHPTILNNNMQNNNNVHDNKESADVQHPVSKQVTFKTNTSPSYDSIPATTTTIDTTTTTTTTSLQPSPFDRDVSFSSTPNRPQTTSGTRHPQHAGATTDRAVDEEHRGFLGVPRARVVAADLNTTGTKDFVVYKIRVGDDSGTEWTVSRRFRHFEVLHRQLRSLPSYRYKLPPKRIFIHSQNVDFVEERRHALDSYLQDILKTQQLRESADVWEFLKVKSERFELPCGKSQQQQEGSIKAGGGSMKYPHGASSKRSHSHRRTLSKSVLSATQSIGRGVVGATVDVTQAVTLGVKAGVNEVTDFVGGGVGAVLQEARSSLGLRSRRSNSVPYGLDDEFAPSVTTSTGGGMRHTASKNTSFHSSHTTHVNDIINNGDDDDGGILYNDDDNDVGSNLNTTNSKDTMSAMKLLKTGPEALAKAGSGILRTATASARKVKNVLAPAPGSTTTSANEGGRVPVRALNFNASNNNPDDQHGSDIDRDSSHQPNGIHQYEQPIRSSNSAASVSSSGYVSPEKRSRSYQHNASSSRRSSRQPRNASPAKLSSSRRKESQLNAQHDAVLLTERSSAFSNPHQYSVSATMPASASRGRQLSQPHLNLDDEYIYARADPMESIFDAPSDIIDDGHLASPIEVDDFGAPSPGADINDGDRRRSNTQYYYTGTGGTGASSSSSPYQALDECSGISAPLYDIIDCLFQLQTRGFFRRHVYTVARQIVSMVAGDAVDVYLITRLRLLRQESTIAKILQIIQSSLWPGGIWFQNTPQHKAMHNQTTHSTASASTSTAPRDGAAAADEGERPMSPMAALHARDGIGMKAESYLEPSGPTPIDHDEIRDAVYELLLQRAPTALIRLVGKNSYAEGVEDLYEMIQSATFMRQLGYGLLEIGSLHLCPELKTLFRSLEHGGL